MNQPIRQLILPALSVIALASGAPAAFGEDVTNPPGCQTIIVTSTGDGEQNLIKCVTAGYSPLLVTVGSGAGTSLMTVTEDSDRGWLGVMLGEVPQALSAQLALDGPGVMITNVVTDSPASRAGLNPYDVVLAIDGQPVDGSIATFAEKIGQAGPGTQVSLTVIAGGKEQTVKATLGQRPKGKDVTWMQDLAVFGPAISETFRTHGKVIRVGPGGNVVLEDLGDLKLLDELPQAVLDVIPNIDDVLTRVWVDVDAGDVNTHITTRVQKDGNTIEIEKEGDGAITVRRTTVDDDGNSQTTEKVYQDPDQLKADDQEAFEIFSGIQGDHVIDLRLSDIDEVYDADDIRADIQDHVRDAIKVYEDAFKDVNFRPTPGISHFGAFDSPFFHSLGRARHNFSVDSDGQIEIRIRKGDTDVTLNYDNEDQLREQNPEMYQKYRDVMDAPLED